MNHFSLPNVCQLDFKNYNFNSLRLYQILEYLKNGPLLCSSNPFLEEWMAVKKALTWIKDQGLTNVRFESDCQVLVSS